MGDEEENIGSLTKKNTEISIAEASSMFPGFRFSPTDEELISFYLKKKIEGLDNCVEVIPEVDICRYEPWDLPAKSVIQSDNEWFFFSPRGKKYPNGSQSKRATESGYWKATGKERNVKSGSAMIGTKRTLVFHTGRAPKGQRTEWIMHEYCMNEKSQDLMVVCRLKKNSDFHLDDTSRKKSLHPLDVTNNAAASSGNEQTGVSEGAMVADCCSKECSSSNYSHSVEQIDCGFDSDEKITNDLSHHASSSNHKENNSNEEDYFADIMKDDIIKLDDAAFRVNPIPLSTTAPEESESKKKSKQLPQTTLSSALPFQGTANRRLKLRRQKLGLYEQRPFNTCRVRNLTCPSKLVNHADSQLSSKCMTGLFSGIQVKRISIFISLIILVLLFLFLQAGKFLKSDCRSSLF